MYLTRVPKRSNWQETVVAQGVPYFQVLDPNGGTPAPYWNEGYAYSFTVAEIDKIVKAASELWDMLTAVGSMIVQSRDYNRLAIPPMCWEKIEQTWWGEPPSLTARFDLAYNPDTGAIKMLEINAQTPTSLPEAAVVQWSWLEDMKKLHPEVFQDADQFNLIHESIVAAWKRQVPKGSKVHFSCIMPEDAYDNGEDLCNVSYLADTAREAGLEVVMITSVHEIRWSEAEQAFHDPDLNKIRYMFMLYPWEWVFNDKPEEFAPHILTTMDIGTRADELGNLAAANPTAWINPLYNMLWANKGVLALLHEAYPNSEYLLPAHLDGPRDMQDYVKKPLLSREGQNVTIVRNGRVVEAQPGEYGREGFVYQQYVDLRGHPDESGVLQYPVLGVWMAGGSSGDETVAGMGIRSSTELVTNNVGRFTPHFITSQ
jgi:glutathionylspermidine synthase